MRFTLAAAAAVVPLAIAAPIEERQTYATDAQILNYALTLEYLESTFYNQTLQKFSYRDFRNAGLDGTFYNNLQEIAYDEATHVSFLSGALTAAGATPVQACQYNFGLTDVKSFLQTASILEGVGVSAYLGAAQYISNKAYLTAAGSILTVEARHSAYLRENQQPGQSPFPAPFDIPLSFSQVYSLAALFITSCNNPQGATLPPVKAFPALTLTSKSPVYPGQTISVKSAMNVNGVDAWFFTASGPVEAKLTGSGSNYQVVVPNTVQAGQEYLVLTSDKNMPTDNNIVAGPAIIPVADNLTGVDKNWEHSRPWSVKNWWNYYGGNWNKP